MTQNSLQHVGVKGMHWGIRKAQEATKTFISGDKSQKVANILNKKNLDAYDKRRFEYLADPLQKRVAKAASGYIRQQVVQEAVGLILTGKLSMDYTSKTNLAKLGKELAVSTAKNMALDEVLSRTALTRYETSGRLKKRGLVNAREDILQAGINAAETVLPIVGGLAGWKLKQIHARRQAAREIFEKWGANILPEKVDNVIWQSEDLGTAVIDPSGKLQ